MSIVLACENAGISRRRLAMVIARGEVLLVGEKPRPKLDESTLRLIADAWRLRKRTDPPPKEPWRRGRPLRK